MKFCKKSKKLLGLFSEMFQKNFQVIGFTAQLGKHKLNNKGNHNALRLDNDVMTVGLLFCKLNICGNWVLVLRTCALAFLLNLLVLELVRILHLRIPKTKLVLY